MRREIASDPPLYFCIRGDEILVEDKQEQYGFPSDPPAGTHHIIGSLDGRVCIAVDVDDTGGEADGAWITLRKLYGRVADIVWTIAGRASQIVTWDRTHRFCGRCGTPTEPDPDARARRCPACGLVAFPRLAPAVIVLVTRGENDDETLLAWGTRWSTPFYSTLAGFVEPGESLEEAVAREVKEETGIDVTDIRYFGSQPWPFPHQLMVGFLARYAGGEITPQEGEIVEARWFRADELDSVSTPRGGMSIAAWMIERWLATRRS